MRFEMQLVNPHFHWEKHTFEGINYFFKGNLFYNEELLTLEELIYVISTMSLMSDKFNFDELISFLRGLNGNYAFIIESSEQVICVVDRIRSIPLFYSMVDEKFTISDDAYYIKDRIRTSLIEKNAAEFLVTGYVTGSETLFDNIKQLQAGEVLIYKKTENSLQTSYYFRFTHKDSMVLSEEELLSKLDTCFINVFKRLIESTVEKGKQIVVPLSGGLDSRIIVATLKKLGVENVICYTYGRKNELEVTISRQVAKELGYKWYFVEYNERKWKRCLTSKEFQEFEKYSSNLSSLYCIQEFLAIYELKKLRKLPLNSVILPGHSGDMLAGSHIPFSYSSSFNKYCIESFLEDNLNKHYINWKWNINLRVLFENNIINSIGHLNIHDSESCANAIELFDFKERQAKFIVNSVRNYEVFDYEWRLPLWDSLLIDFFLQVPLKYRLNQNLYINYSISKLFVGNLEHLAKIKCTTIINRGGKYRKKVDTLFILIHGVIFKTWAHDFKKLQSSALPKNSLEYKRYLSNYIVTNVLETNNCIECCNLNSSLTLNYLTRTIDND